jgi:protein SCO1/2
VTPARRSFLRLLPVLVLLGCANRGVGAAESLDPETAMRASQAAIGGLVGDHLFTDSNGRPLSIASLRGRPLLVSYVFTSCGFICPTLTTNLARATTMAREVLGDDAFAVVTVGFDTAVDTPEQMRRYARERGIEAPAWYFLSGDQATVDALARDIGFSYAPAGGAYDHLTQVTIVDAGGRVHQQVYGTDITGPMIVDPLKRLALQTGVGERPVASLLERVRLICTSYDPKSGRYRFDYSLILEIAIGISCAIAVLAFLVHAWRQGRSARAAGS